MDKIMIKILFRHLLLSSTALILIGCGEVTTSNDKTPSATNNPTTLGVNSERETVTSSLSTTVMLKDIVATVNTISTTKSNKYQVVQIKSWIEKITQEVSELTSKDYTLLINQYQDKKLFAINDKLFSTDKNLTIGSDGHISVIKDSFTIVKGSCETVAIMNSIVVCTENIHASKSENSVIISNGEVELTAVGTDTTINKGSLIYSKKSVTGSFIKNSVFLFSDTVETTLIENSDCINTNNSTSQTGICNELTTSRLIEE
jgi:hypothetical protein